MEKVVEAPLIVIVGPTASGKTALAIEFALQFDGEIICADSRTVYKYMDIGTAKPSKEEQKLVPHWGLDLVEPGQRFTAADFKKYAEQKIAEIRARGKVPLLAGGTGLYIDSVIFDYQFGGDINTTQREMLEKLSVEKLQKYCSENNVEMPKNHQNRRHLIRAIERKGISSKRRKVPIENTLVVGITAKKEVLQERIASRAEQLFANGVVEEATMLGKKYGWEGEAMTGNIYPLINMYLNKQMTESDVKARFTTLDWQLAKRQMTWFKRNPYIQWFELCDAKEYLQKVLGMV
jgi:tRNA dimethylallyltransferase